MGRDYHYHVGCGINAIFAGRLNGRGDMWTSKSDVTEEAYKAVALYCIEHDEAMEFDYRGKRYRLDVRQISE